MDRRTFVGVLSASLAASSPPPARRERRLERIGLELYTVRQALERDFEPTLARVAATGYQEVEFAGYFGKPPGEVRAILARQGLAAPAAHVAWPLDDAWRAALDAAHVIGHHYLVLPSIPLAQRQTVDDYKRVAETCNRAAAEARAAGIQFAYHNHDFEFAPLEGRVPYDVLLSETDPTLVQLEMDLYWIIKGGGDPLAYFARWPGRIALVHVKDSAGPPAHRMVDVGEGVIDFRRIFAQRERAGIKHFFVEHDEPADAFASIRASYLYLKGLEF